MTHTEIMDLEGKRTELIKSAREITSKYEQGKEFPAEVRETVDKILAEETSLKSQIDQAKQVARVEALHNEQYEFKRKSHPTSKGLSARMDQREAIWHWAKGNDSNSPEIRETLSGYGFNGNKLKLRSLELRSLTEGGDAGATVGIDQSLMTDIEISLKLNSGIMDACRIVETDDGQELPFPRFNDTGTIGYIQGEGEDLPISVSPVDIGDDDISQVSLFAWKYGPKYEPLEISIELLQDSRTDWEQLIWDSATARIARAFNLHATRTGSGTNTPQALMSGSNVIRRPNGQSEVLKWQNLVSQLEHKIDPAYRREKNNNVGYMLSDATLAYLKVLEDGNGRPIFRSAYETPGQVDTLNGYPFWINTDMADVADNALCLVFGNFKRAYVVRKVREVTMVRDPYTLSGKGLVRFQMFMRLDGRRRNENAYAIYSADAL